MCGIVAIVSRETPIREERLERAVLRLRHRGPDAQQWWLAPHGRAGLGHARLSVIDLATGAQPIASEDGALHLVVNGEFYGYEALRCELKRRRHQFRTRSDSEVALHLYEERGVGCLADLRGEFAFALWDERRQALFAARDRFGIKPLFYTMVQGALLLASEVKALAAAGLPLAWDRESVFQSLFACVAPDRTLFAGVKQVPPGHYLVATRESLRVAPYWEVNYPKDTGARPDRHEKEWIEELRARVEEAVRLRLRADVPVGCMLSGGLDSSAALGVARKHSPGTLSAFTIAFDHPDYDESEIARETAWRAGAVFHPVRVTNSDFAAHFADAVWHSESLHYNAHGVARHLLSRAVRDAGLKVMLAGEGADEIGAGYHFCEKALESGATGSWLKVLRALPRLCARKNAVEELIAETSPWLVRASRWIGFPETALGYVAEKIGVMRGFLSEDFAAEFKRRDPYREFFRGIHTRDQLAGREPVKQLLYLWMKSFFPNYVLAGERLDMAHGVEVRLPFLDHKLFEFARDIPAALLARSGRQKFALREAMRPFVTEQVYAGRKRPFLAPPSALQPGSEFFALVRDTLRGGTMEGMPFFNRRAVADLLDRLPSLGAQKSAALDPVFLLLTSMCVLHERYRL
jgi:asparagine synthase (glutamine-hydrolysing)